MADNDKTIDIEKVDEHLREIDKMFETRSVFQRLKILFTGLGKPRSSKEYKEAVIEAQRLSAPFAAIVLPVLAVLVLVLMSNGSVDDTLNIETTIMDAQTIEDLDTPENEEMPPEDMSDVQIDIQVDAPNVQVDTPQPVANQPVTPQPATFDSVRNTASPVILRNIYGQTRNTGTRGTQLAKFGGDKQTEGAVLRALRWLKKHQNPDGSWTQGNKCAMTGIGILTFLAHGEKPGEANDEFGPTVQKALEFLLKNQTKDGRFKFMDGNQYALPIATYALCEAYGMTLNPNVKAAAERALVPIIKGQHPSGGWTYKCNPDVDKSDEGKHYAFRGGYRDDTSYMGWCAQALKAAKLAKIHVDGLEKSIKLCIKGFKGNAHKDGGFGYCTPGRGGLTSVGTLSMMLLGARNDGAVKKALDLMDNWTPFFGQRQAVLDLAKVTKPTKDRNAEQIAISQVNSKLAGKVGGLSGNPQYYFYYATQCKFHEGGKHWDNWNKAMKPVYVRAQKIIKDDAVDANGKKVDTGYWENSDTYMNGCRPMFDTCLAALQLMVYYRYLPTTSKSAVEVEEEVVAVSTDNDDIAVDINL